MQFDILWSANIIRVFQEWSFGEAKSALWILNPVFFNFFFFGLPFCVENTYLKAYFLT